MFRSELIATRQCHDRKKGKCSNKRKSEIIIKKEIYTHTHTAEAGKINDGKIEFNERVTKIEMAINTT